MLLDVAPPVGAVRAYECPAPRGEHPCELAHGAHVVAGGEVLQHVGAEHEVEGRRPEGQLRRRRLRQLRAQAERPALRDRRRRQVDGDHRAGRRPIVCPREEGARSGTGVEHSEAADGRSAEERRPDVLHPPDPPVVPDRTQPGEVAIVEVVRPAHRRTVFGPVVALRDLEIRPIFGDFPGVCVFRASGHLECIPSG